MQTPPDLVVVGYIAGAYGVHGLVRVRSYSEDADALLSVLTWWLEQEGQLREIEVLDADWHNDEVLAHLSGISDRDQAEALRGCVIKIPRSAFPDLEEDEFYWVDLIGLSVINLRGEKLGTIHDLMENGAHQILRVTPEKADESDKKRREILIPFVEQIVQEVDQLHKKVVVDWEQDY